MKHKHTADELDYGTTQIAGYTVELVQDIDAESPREYDNIGTMVCWHRNYTLGDEQPNVYGGESPEDYIRNLVAFSIDDTSVDYDDEDADEQYAELVRKQFAKDYFLLPLILYDHSGISMSTTTEWPYNCPWDAGQVGFIYASKAKLKEEGIMDGAKALRQEVETYDQYLRGDVYGYTITDPEGEHVDSCWGFIGGDYAMEQAIEALNSALDDKHRGHMDDVKTWIKHGVPLEIRQELSQV